MVVEGKVNKCANSATEKPIKPPKSQHNPQLKELQHVHCVASK